MTRGRPMRAASIARWLVTGSWNPGVGRNVPHGRIAHSGLLTRLDRHGTGMPRIPSRLGEPQAVRVSCTQIERVSPRGPMGLAARRQRGTLVRDEQIARGEEPR